ncbi:MAG: hypothetical protein LBR29_10070 [Methylobacteriaceae bacterium]|jgi:hypothetical protein|nr:hypothetical protein [Methylobacteriaceae bacterium]
MNYDRIILELMDRVSRLEDEVAALKQSVGSGSRNDAPLYDSYVADVMPSRRDTTKYLFDGKYYGKNRLVLAVVKKYAGMNPDITAEKLTGTFDKSIQGSLGVVQTWKEVKEKGYADPERRFFMSDDEVIETRTGRCVVCTQWASENIKRFIARALELGFDITPIR